MAINLIKINEFPESVDTKNWMVVADANGISYKISIENVKAELGIGALMQYRGSVVPTSPVQPAGDFFVTATQNGTYTNYGGVVVPVGSFAVISRVSGVYTSSITALDTNAVLKTDLLTQAIGSNLFNPALIVPAKYIDPTTFAILTTGGGAYIMSGKIPVNESTIYRLNGYSGISYAIPIRFLNSSGALISGVVPSGANVNATTFTFTTPVGCTHIEFTIKTGKPGDVTDPNNIMLSLGSAIIPFEPYTIGIVKITDIPLIATYGPTGEPTSGVSLITKNSLDSALVGLKGKNIMFFGDSITADSTNAGAPNRTSWVTYFIEKTGCVRLNNYAFSGGSFTDWAYDTNPRQMMSAQVNDAIASGLDPDILIVAMGTNDYFRKAAFGDYDTAMGKTIANLNKAIVMEAARWAFYKLQEAFPNAIKYYALPIQRASAISEDGVWLRDGLTQMANRYNFLLINSHDESGIIKDFEVSGSPGRFLHDGLHPSNLGYELMSTYFINKIRIRAQL